MSATVGAVSTRVETPDASTVRTIVAGRRRRLRRRVLVVAGLAAAMLAMFAVSLMVGDTFYTPAEVWRVLTGETVPGASFTVGDLRPTDREAAELRLLQLDTRSPVPGFAQADDVLAREIARADADRQQRRADLCAALGIAHEQITSSDEVIAACLRLLERTRRAAR